MTFYPKSRIGSVIIDNIDIDNDEYKISKPRGDEKLKQSIQSSGLLDAPVLYEDNNTYKIVFGHNRLSILKELNIADTLCCIIDVPEPKAFIDYGLLKNYRSEIGPIGKCKYIRILKNNFSLNEEEISIAAKDMQIPEDILSAGQLEQILSLPESIKNYLDLKDIGFKIIKKILRLSGETRILLSNWVVEAAIRVNIFKAIVDLILDIDKIIKKEKSFSMLASIDLNSIEFKSATERKDEALYRMIYKMRYPEYTEIKSKAERIINDIAQSNLEIHFPEYFEKDEIGILLKISKRDNIEEFDKMVSRIDTDDLKKLLDLL